MRITILLLIVSFQVFCQHNADTLQAGKYFNLGNSFFDTGKHDSSVIFLNKALVIYSGIPDYLKVIRCYNVLTHNFLQMSELDKASQCVQKAIKTNKAKLNVENRELAQTLDLLGMLYEMEGKYSEALKQFQKSLLMRQRILSNSDKDIASSYALIGLNHYKNGHYDWALNYMKKCLAINIKNLGEDHLHVARTYNSLGLIYSAKRDLDLSLVYYYKVLSIAEKKLGGENPYVSITYSNLGSVYEEKGQYEKALTYYKRTLGIRKKVFGDRHYSTAITYNKIGNVHVLLEEYDSAFHFLKKSLNIRKELGGEQHLHLAYSYKSLAELFNKKDKYDSAIYYYTLSIDIFEKLFIKNNDLALAYSQIGVSYRKSGNLSEALVHHQKSLIANNINFFTNNYEKNPGLDDYLDATVYLKTLGNKAIDLQSMFIANKNKNYLITALNTISTADSLIHKIRKSHRTQTDKVSQGKLASKIYETGIEICLQLHTLNGDKKYLYRAFEFSERGKAGTLREALLNNSSKTFSIIPKGLQSLEIKYKADIAFYYSKIHEINSNVKSDTNALKEFQIKLFKTNNSYDSLILSFKKYYPDYYKLKYEQTVTGVEELQKRISPNTALIEYFVGDQNIYVFTLTKDNIKYHILKNDKKLLSSVEALRNSLNPKYANSNPQEAYNNFVSDSYLLFKNYLKESLKSAVGKDRLIIIPDAELGYIPFDILLTSNAGPNSNYRSLPYLLNKYKVSYGYSATILFENYNQNNKPLNSDLIAFAPNYESNKVSMVRSAQLGKYRDLLTSLDWTKPEINNINKYIKGVSYVDDEAEETKFKLAAGKYNIIHLAMHAVIDDEQPMYSKLVFSESKKDTLDDGLLNAYELYNMKIPAQLVVLSACETGYGKFERGEGIMSLARAFSFAGCPSIVMSQWLVDDEATAQIMELLYKYLAQGLEKDIALQKAKQDFLKSADVHKQNPAFWAGFVVLGDTKPIESKSFVEKHLTFILVTLLVLILIAVLILKRKRISI